jgi:O-antigen ligase
MICGLCQDNFVSTKQTLLTSSVERRSSTAAGHRVSESLRTILFAGLCILLLSGPLAFGIVEAWSTELFESGAAFLLLIWLGWYLSDGKLQIQWSPLFPPMLTFAGIVAVQIAFHRTAYVYDSLSALALYAAYGFLIFIAVQSFRSTETKYFGNILALFGSLYVVFAVLQSVTSSGKIYWRIIPQTTSVFGSYVNHNHYAGLIEMLLPFSLVLVFKGSRPGGVLVLQIFGAIVMAASVFLSKSRGGMVAVSFEVMFFAIIWIRFFSAKRGMAFVMIFGAATAAILAAIAPEQVISRITDLHDPARLLIHRDSIRMFLAHPLLGSGFGTFTNAFRHYRTFFDGFFVNHAHDDYLELALETGVIGFATAVWFLVVVYRQGFRNLSSARQSGSATVSAAALVGCTGLLVHSFVDFNLHVPGNAALFYVLAAVATLHFAGTEKHHAGPAIAE